MEKALKPKQGEKFREWSQRLLMETKVKEWEDYELLAMHTIIQDEIIYRADKIVQDEKQQYESED